MGLVVIAFVVLIGVMVAKAWPAQEPSTALEGTAVTVTALSTITPVPTLAPTPALSSEKPEPAAPSAPDFTLPDLEGQMWSLSQFRGRPVLLFFWATW